MNKRIQSFILMLILLLLTACGAADAVTPETTTVTDAPANIAAAETAETEPEMATDTPTVTNTPGLTLPTRPPATTTVAPEPETATPLPTATTPPTATATTAATATETAIPTEPAAATAAPTTSSTTAGNDSPTAPPPAAPTDPPPPPPAGGVPNPANQNYPGNNDRAGWESRINVPPGFTVTYVGRVLDGEHPTSITFGPDALLYIAIQEGKIYTMNSSGVLNLFTSGFLTPTGIAFRPGTSDLYVSSWVRDGFLGDGEAQVSVVGRGQLFGGLPCCYTGYHSAHGIAFGPDGMGYVGVGSRADHGEILTGPNAGQPDTLQPLEASIVRFNPDTGETSVYARGFRNPYDIAWDSTGQLWATDNAPDYNPPERLHRVVPGGEHGYPWYDCDVCFSPPAGVNLIPPLVTFPPHGAPTGVTVYKAAQFPGYYDNIFVTLWTGLPGLQKVMRIGAGGSAPSNFATGFAQPIDVTVGPDGNLYVADWATGIIFKISYTG